MTGVTGRHRGGARVTLQAETIVVAAGPIGSSGLLLRSGIGGDGVGRGLHFNVNSPLTAEFADEVDAFAGIQMSHAYVPPGDPPPYLVETWFNPPATQALAMPGWFGRHWAHMHRFRRMACAGVLVGTTRPGRVTAKGIAYDPAPEDRDRVLEGLEVAGRIWLAAGATRVMPATFAFREYASEAALTRLPADLRGAGDLLMTSAHPQGGNAIGSVVGPDFRVDRDRQPLSVRRERVPHERPRQPAAHGHGPRGASRPDDPRRGAARRARGAGHAAYGAGVSSRSGAASATAVTLRSAFESART